MKTRDVRFETKSLHCTLYLQSTTDRPNSVSLVSAFPKAPVPLVPSAFRATVVTIFTCSKVCGAC